MANDDLQRLRDSAIADPDVPSVVRDMLRAGARLDELRLSAFGQWLYNGVPVEHPRVRALFSRSLTRTSAGTWVLSVPPYTYPVIVDDAPQFVFRIRGAQPEGLMGTDEWHVLDLNTLETDGDAYLGVRVDGAPARLVGPAYQDLLDHVDQGADGWFVQWGDRRIGIAPRTQAARG